MMWDPNLATEGFEIWRLPTFGMTVVDDVEIQTFL